MQLVCERASDADFGTCGDERRDFLRHGPPDDHYRAVQVADVVSCGWTPGFRVEPPRVVTRDDVAERLMESGTSTSTDKAIAEVPAH